MDRKRIARLLCALLCMALLMTDLPANMMRAAADIAAPAEEAPALEAAEADGAEAEADGEEAEADGAEEADAESTIEAAGLPAADDPAEPDEASEEIEPAPVEEHEAPSAEAIAAAWVGDMDVEGDAGDYAKALWLYDRVILNFERGEASDAAKALTSLSGSPLGYANALAALLEAAGIECRVVREGDAAWNIAKLDGAWAHIDAFADDAPGSCGAHFALSDAEMARDHQWSAELPACAGAKAPSAAPDEGEAEADADSTEVEPDADSDEAENSAEAGEAEGEAHPLVLEAAATAIKPSVDSLVLGKGESAHIGYTLLPEGADEAVSFSVKPKGIVVGDQNGNILAKKTGKAVVYLTTSSGKSAEVKISVKKAPSKVSVTGDRRELGVGESEQLGAKLPSGSAGSVTFSISSGKSHASISEDGLLTALSPGSVSVVAEAYNGKRSKAATIEIKPAPTAVFPPMEEMRIGQGDFFVPEWTLDEGSAGKLSFSSSNPTAVNVDPDSGEITGMRIGEAVVTASAYGVASGEMRVSVVPPLTGIELDEAPVLGAKQTLQIEPKLLAEGGPFEGNVCTLRYKSSKTSVASVNSAGRITAKKAGKAKITIQAGDDIRASFQLVVKKAPTSVSIVSERRELGVGETLRLGYNLKPSNSAGSVTFSIPEGQRGIASVTEDGLLSAIAPGEFQVTATTHNNKKKSLSFEVLPAPTAIEILYAPERLGVSATDKVRATLDNGLAGGLRFRAVDPDTGEDSDVAYIDESGEITALRIGEAIIEITTYAEGVSASARLRVVPSPDALALPEASIELGVDDTYQIAPIPLPEGSAASYSYKSSKKSYASVDDDGLVTGEKVGDARITVESHNGASVSLDVSVKKKPGSVALSAHSLTLGEGECAQLEAEIPANSATTLRYASDDEGVASVSPEGEVTALAEGEAVISVSTHNGKRDECAVSVVPAPSAIRFEENYSIGADQRNFLPTYTLEPENAHTSLRYELVSGTGVRVEDGRIAATADRGAAVIRAYTHVDGVYGEFHVTVVPAPEAIELPENFVVTLDGPRERLLPTFVPSDSAADLRYEITSKMKKADSYFTIDPETGWIDPLKETSSGIEVTVTASNGVSARTMIWVQEDASKPLVLEYLGESPASIKHYESYTPDLYIFPEGSDPKLQWSSSDTDIATVGDDGVVWPAQKQADKPYPSGRVTITGTSASNPKLSVKYKLIVLSEDRCLIMPEHRTDDASTIAGTRSDILDVRASAYAELDELEAMGWITASERKTRKNFVDRAFEMYDFAWSPNSVKYYWKAANSEGGEKDFKPENIYFGMAYTQNNRCNWPQKLIDNGYVKKEKNYYRTTDSFKSRSYPGSDCSSFCSMAVWGFNSGRNSNTTSTIASASYYYGLGEKYWTDLRPGDLICLGGHHVVMFLYYTNAARTQFVVIEQGGGGDDPYSNCVSTSIRDASYYKSRKYKIRRPEGLAKNFVADR